MKSYEETIRLTAEFNWWLSSKMPHEYMPEVFGLMPEEAQELARGGNCFAQGIAEVYIAFCEPSPINMNDC